MIRMVAVVPPEFLSERDTCSYVNMSRSSVRRLMKASAFPLNVRLTARRIAWRLSDLEEWAANPEAWAKAHALAD